jgi:hypothetical protein
VNGDIEALLRSGLAEQAERAPETIDDPALADLAIAGAHRIRRRRRIGAAAGAACLLAFGGGTFVLKPLLTADDQMPSAADTSTVEVRSELGMEFLVEDGGSYHVINDSGDRVTVSEDLPQEVYRLESGYLVTSTVRQSTTFANLDGTMGVTTEWPSEFTRTVVNREATEFALATPDEAVTVETYEINRPGPAGDIVEAVEFTTSYEVTLTDWSDSTAVFSADLWSATAGQEKTWHFDEEYDWNLESVGAAGYESAVILDYSNPAFICVADLDAGGGLAKIGEYCGDFESELVQEELVTASGEDAAAELVDAAVAEQTGEEPGLLTDPADVDLGEYEDQYDQADYLQYDPYGRWELSYGVDDSTWVLIDYTGDSPAVSRLTPPAGAIMPVLDMRPPE